MIEKSLAQAPKAAVKAHKGDGLRVSNVPRSLNGGLRLLYLGQPEHHKYNGRFFAAQEIFVCILV